MDESGEEITTESEQQADLLEEIGPRLDEASKPKRRKQLDHEELYLEQLPSACRYERSYMHRSVITHMLCTASGFLLSASQDGCLKFWRKTQTDVEFVKQFRAHAHNIICLRASFDGQLACTLGDADTRAKVFDVTNFDMINMLSLAQQPGCCEWAYGPGSAVTVLAVAQRHTSAVTLYDARGDGTVLRCVPSLHPSAVVLMRYNVAFRTMISVDTSGIIEYWDSSVEQKQSSSSRYDFESKLDTDLYELVRCKCRVNELTLSRDGQLFAVTATDKRVRVFRFLSGKLTRVLDESLDTYTELQKNYRQLPQMEFNKCLFVEKQLIGAESFRLDNAVFDSSGHFLLYGTPLGVKVVNLYSNTLVRTLGKPEHIRFLNLCLYQNKPAQSTTLASSLEREACDNPNVAEQTSCDPTLFCLGFNKNRFYIFSTREPDDSGHFHGADEALAPRPRDIINEKPSKEEVLAATTLSVAATHLSEAATIHTSLGDIHLRLFPKQCPRTVENFCTHSRNGYYNGHIFHRVIKSFMIQTGDPLGVGTGGESVWGGEFEDEFDDSLRHDKPFTLSMANAGPNTNGSQFFITLVPTPWLDRKHTVFGRCTAGMDTCCSIGLAKTNPRTDKPYDDITIISVSIN